MASPISRSKAPSSSVASKPPPPPSLPPTVATTASKPPQDPLLSPSSKPSPAVISASTNIHAPPKDDVTKSTETTSGTHEEVLETIHMETFNQILDLDEEDSHEFSKGMAWAYFSQVSTTFKDMDSALDKKDLKKLSDLGHFLKGSSAALGVQRVSKSCERIQHYGKLRDEERNVALTRDEALKMIDDMLDKAKKDYTEAEKWLKGWYKENAPDPDEDG